MATVGRKINFWTTSINFSRRTDLQDRLNEIADIVSPHEENEDDDDDSD